eukprot:s1153_g4.t3
MQLDFGKYLELTLQLAEKNSILQSHMLEFLRSSAVQHSDSSQCILDLPKYLLQTLQWSETNSLVQGELLRFIARQGLPASSLGFALRRNLPIRLPRKLMGRVLCCKHRGLPSPDLNSVPFTTAARVQAAWQVKAMLLGRRRCQTAASSRECPPRRIRAKRRCRTCWVCPETFVTSRGHWSWFRGGAATFAALRVGAQAEFDRPLRPPSENPRRKDHRLRRLMAAKMKRRLVLSEITVARSRRQEHCDITIVTRDEASVLYAPSSGRGHLSFLLGLPTKAKALAPSQAEGLSKHPSRRSSTRTRPKTRDRMASEVKAKEYDLADKNGLADFLEHANIQLGGPGKRRISKDALHVIVRNLKGDRFTVDMLQDILQEVAPDREGLLNCEDLARRLRRPDPAPVPQEAAVQAIRPGPEAGARGLPERCGHPLGASRLHFEAAAGRTAAPAAPGSGVRLRGRPHGTCDARGGPSLGSWHGA